MKFIGFTISVFIFGFGEYVESSSKKERIVNKERQLSKERIVNGKEVDSPGKYPWIVIGSNRPCSASLIAPNVLLGSTSCPLRKSDKVLIGAHNQTDISEDREVFTVVKSVTHPDYNTTSYNNDLSVVKINGVSKYTPVVIDDGSSELMVGDELITMGWGTNAIDSYKYSDVLLQIEVDYVSNSDCNTMYEDAEWGNGIYGEMICASRTEGDITYDHCIGDGGAPLIKKSDLTQVGVVSWGEGCANPSYPGVYARVSSSYAWIKSYIDLWKPKEKGTKPKKKGSKPKKKATKPKKKDTKHNTQ